MHAAPSDDARRALALVESDPDARAAFVAAVVAAYPAADDAVALLRERVLPDAAARAARRRELDDLRGIAFGRTITPGDEARAVDAHAAVVDAEQSQRALDAAIDAAVTAVLAAPAASPTARPEHAEPGAEVAAGVIRTPPLWRRLVLPVGAFALGLAVAAVVVPVFFAEEPPAAVADFGTGEGLLPPEVAAAAALRPGDVEAAERWLDRPQTEADLVPLELDGIVASSTRMASGGGGADSVWVARGSDDGLCVVVSIGTEGAYASSCSPPDMFLLHGAMVSLNEGLAGRPSIEAEWDGAHVYVTVGPE